MIRVTAHYVRQHESDLASQTFEVDEKKMGENPVSMFWMVPLVDSDDLAVINMAMVKHLIIEGPKKALIQA